MRRRRARLIAAAIVFLVGVVSAAHGSFLATEDFARSSPATFMTPMRISVSLRNTTSTAQQITNVTLAGSGNDDCVGTITIAPEGGGSFPVMVPGYKQQQLRITAPSGFGSSETMNGAIDPTCVWEVTTTTGTLEFTTQFDVQMGATGWDLEPKLTDFGSQSVIDFEVQKVLLNNHSASPMSYTALTLEGDTTGSLTFNHAECPGMQSCTGGMVAGHAVKVIEVKCDPASASSFSAQLKMYAASSLLASTNVTCTGAAGSGADINIVPASITLSGPQGVLQSYPAMISGTMGNAMGSAEITGTQATAFQLVTAGCTGQTCVFAPALAVDTSLTVTCTPAAGSASATLTVYGTLGPDDHDTADLECLATTGPSISVSPMAIDAMSPPVGTEVGPFPITIANTGTGTLTTTIELSDPDWRADACVSSSCAITSSSPRVVNVYFRPSVHGPDNALLTVDSNAGMEVVTLLGGGAGARLDVVSPEAPFELDFGTLGLNEDRTRTVQLASAGTRGVMVNLTAPTGPYTLSSDLVNLSANGAGSFDVTCRSATAGGPNAGTIGISSDAYGQNTDAIAVRCTVANTEVQVSPSAFDFGELRVGEPDVVLGFTISNPGPEVALANVTLSASRPGLSLTAPGPQTLPSGGSVGGELRLASGTETDLAGVFLEVDVGGEQLRLPVLGRVVTPSAYVTPATLDLGTACVGTQVDGLISMVNDGTATLHVEQPLMDSSSFSASPMTPGSYPAALRAGEVATVRVSPSTSTNGEVASTLSWDADAPTAPFDVPVRLSYIDTGTALSPQQLGFGSVEVDELSPQQGLTLQNCDPTTAIVTVRGVTAIRGPARAWVVTPVGVQTELGARDKLMVYVRFSPRRPGPHRARVELDVGGEIRFVDLEGVGRGELGDEDSFYACSCAGGASPLGGIPIAIGVAIIVWPVRRRRRLSGRCRSGSSSAR